jgi:hypothetical protein
MGKQIIVNNYKTLLVGTFGEEEVNSLMDTFGLNDDNFEEWLKPQIEGHLQTKFNVFRDKYVMDEYNMKQGKPSPYTISYPQRLNLMKANMDIIQEDINLFKDKNIIQKGMVKEVFRVLINFSKARF